MVKMMNFLRIKFSALLLLFVANGAFALSCRDRSADNSDSMQSNKQRILETAREKRNGERKMSDDFEEIKNARFAIADPFVAIVRDADAYAALRALSNDTLPAFDADYFKTHAVIAAFLGQKRTAGYSVKITNETKATRNSGVSPSVEISIEEVTPPRGAMLAQVITAPAKIVSAHADEKTKLKISLGRTWLSAARPYNITAGDFTASGGLAGRREQMPLAGALRVLREGNLATFIFDLKSANASASNSQARTLREAATGVVGAKGDVTLKMIGAGTLVPFPHPMLQARGMFADEAENKLSLTFSSLPTTFADGYEGAGKIEAVAAAPPRPKKQPID
jgi:hypothetical protein